MIPPSNRMPEQGEPALVDVVIEDARWQAAGLETLAETACRATLQALSLAPEQFEIALLACDDGRIATLNTEFRGKASATNVLSWPSEDLAPEEAGGAPFLPQETELGDIAIAYDTCKAEATAQNKPFADHVCHLLVHGTLHLLGYDHISEKDAVRMEGLEVAILAKLGLPDPY